MKMRKQILAIATCICMICGMLPMSAYATETEHEHDFSGPAVDVGTDTHRYYCQQGDCNEYDIDYHDWVYNDCTNPGKYNECRAEGSKQVHEPSARTYLNDEKHYTYCVREGCGVTMYIDSHTGGTATCTEKAVCGVCSGSYGEVDKSNHVSGTEVKNAVEPGEFTEGYTGDTYCKGCGDLLSKGETIPATHVHAYTLMHNDTHH